ncbi:AAA family ATPase [Spirosoma sp. KNUC1025]|uniref:AAA family ATPase n=1 Tax=Spirosoma sp. KNUC1025 TaxID=2894082 RepID=UPI00386BB1DD|nr:AAA family ATPase [Spirosoma sp. KNUC1025]
MLKRVSIQNFKSLKDVTLDLQKVNLLIGPNNSGKTNFLKALELVGDARNKVKYNPSQIAFAKQSPAKINVKLLWPTDEKKFDYKIYKTYFDGSDIVRRSGYYRSSEPDLIISEQVSIPELIHLFSERIKIYKADSSKLDKPGPVGRGDDSITADASNLIAFFDRIRDEYPATFNQIKADLAKCVPEFTEINFQNIEPTEDLVKQFGDKTFKRIGLTNGQQRTIYWADELSEGTLYFIGLLCIINQPNPPKLLLLEEPEKGIHPRRIREIMNFIRRLVAEKDIQVIMTTHSPLLLDEFAESPESVFVFDKDDDGATFVKNLQREIIEPANQKNAELGIPPVHYTDALGEYWTIGFLGGVPHETV